MTDQAPLPKAWGVLYAPPNSDGSKKLCENCAFWVHDTEQCVIHDENIQITAGMVCGYHVNGDPMSSNEIGIITLNPIDPKLSGLEDVSRYDGSSCSSCIYYAGTSASKGNCYAVAKETGQPPQPVQALGCCARWEGK